jgi:hypothetical protein
MQRVLGRCGESAARFTQRPVLPGAMGCVYGVCSIVPRAFGAAMRQRISICRRRHSPKPREGRVMLCSPDSTLCLAPEVAIEGARRETSRSHPVLARMEWSMPWLIRVITGTEFNEWSWLRDPPPPPGFCNSDFVPTPEQERTPLHIQLRTELEAIPHYSRGPGKQGDIIVSREFKEKIEELDTERHYFIPVVIHHPDGRVQEGTHFLFTMGTFVDDGIIVSESDINKHPRFDRYLATSLTPRIMWRGSKIGGRHIWADKRFQHGVTMSDDLYAELRRLGIGDLIGKESRIDGEQ